MMAEAQGHPSPGSTITLAEMNGRIIELEAQRNEALKRCAVLAGEKALAHDVLRQARAEIDRLNGIVAAPAAPGEAAGSALN